MKKERTLKQKQNFQKGKLKAFSILEIVMALGIIGIMYMLVMPNNGNTVAMARSMEARAMLNQVYSLEKNYYFMYSKYTTDLEEIGFEQEQLVTENGQAHYLIQIEEASDHNFKATAVAVKDFDGDGKINKWSIDQNKSLKEDQKD